MKGFNSVLLGALLFFSSMTAFSQTPPPPPPADTTGSLDKIFDRVEVEASYPGGVNEWISFLQKNLNAETPVNNNAPAGKFTVLVQFIVDKDGSISEIKPLTSLGYGMEQEVVRILKQSGKWTPAIQNGRPVKAYRKQPVTFQVEDDEIEIITKTPFVLYTNTDNPLTINVYKVKPEDVLLTITQGAITKMGDGRYVVKLSKPGRVIIRVYNSKKDKEVGAVSFEVRE